MYVAAKTAESQNNRDQEARLASAHSGWSQAASQ
jgi:hypothetical protein